MIFASFRQLLKSFALKGGFGRRDESTGIEVAMTAPNAPKVAIIDAMTVTVGR